MHAQADVLFECLAQAAVGLQGGSNANPESYKIAVRAAKMLEVSGVVERVDGQCSQSHMAIFIVSAQITIPCRRYTWGIPFVYFFS
eukprot:874231-Prorocentrum_minimum.AAC.6